MSDNTVNKILIEEKQYDFITDGFLRPMAPIRRFSQGGNRFYYKVDETSGDVTLYSSGTTLIKDGYAESEANLEDWRNKLKAEGKNPKYELAYAAMRGTLLHILAGDFIQQKQIIFDLNTYFATNHPEITTEPLYYDVIYKDSLWLQKGLLAFAQFCKDYNVKPLAIELMMASDTLKVASPIDLICTMDYEEKGFFGEVYKSGEKKGQPKESKVTKHVTAIIDLKSSKNGFYDKHFFQLHLYKRLVKENYPEIEVSSLYNWSPKEWTGETPTYNLKEQTTGSLEKLCDVVFEQGRLKHEGKEPSVTIVPESIMFGVDFQYTKVPLKEYLKTQHGKRDEDKKGSNE